MQKFINNFDHLSRLLSENVGQNPGCHDVLGVHVMCSVRTSVFMLLLNFQTGLLMFLMNQTTCDTESHHQGHKGVELVKNTQKILD